MKKVISFFITVSVVFTMLGIVMPASAESATSSVEKKFIVDGYLDPYYITAEGVYSWECLDIFKNESSGSSEDHHDKASVWTAYDTDYIYMFVRVNNDRYPYSVPGEYGDDFNSLYDTVEIWMDQDPYTQDDDLFFRNTADPNQSDSSFTYYVGNNTFGEYHDIEKRGYPLGVKFGDYIKNSENAVSRMLDQNNDGTIDGYSFEIRYPRIPVSQRRSDEPEDIYRFNVVCGFSSAGWSDDGYNMALAPDWNVSYDNLPKIYFDDENNPFFDRIIYGDVDKDGSVTSMDSLCILNKSIGKVSFDESQTLKADVDLNGIVNSTDGLITLQYSIKKIEKLPFVQNPEDEKVEINEQNFPDPVFIEDVKSFDTDGDGYLSKNEIECVEEMDLYAGEYFYTAIYPSIEEPARQKINNLKGIEYFTSLKKLKCDYNPVKKIDLSKNTELTSLSCNKCRLTELDVTKNRKLEVLKCASNELTSLDLSNNSELKQLFAIDNDIAVLDLTNNINLSSSLLFLDFNVIVKIYD